MTDEERSQLDARLRRAVLRGDEFAWRSLVARYGPDLEGAARRQRSGADDLVQETWMIALRRMRDFDPARGSLGAWLYGVLQGVARNRGRQRSAESLVFEPVSDAAAETRRRGEEVGAVLDAIEPEARRLLVVEIADREGRTVKAVESDLVRARAAFRARWDGERRPNHDDA